MRGQYVGAPEALKSSAPTKPVVEPEPPPNPGITPHEPEPGSVLEPPPRVQSTTIRVAGAVPPEVWNRLGTKILPKLRSGSELKIRLDFSVTVNADTAGSLVSDLRQLLQELGLAETLRVE
jgi:hypothetical protein